MTDTQTPLLHLPKHSPRSQAAPEWDARRYMSEAAYWAEHFDEFERRLPRIRAARGDKRAARLMRDVLEEIAAVRGDYLARYARERLMGRWHEQAPGRGERGREREA